MSVSFHYNFNIYFIEKKKNFKKHLMLYMENSNESF
jgi:hypothetical protein